MLKFRLVLFPVMLGLSCIALAQVYKSTDADGNVIFSDTPATDSEEVEITSPNIANPVEVPANVTAPEPEAVNTVTNSVTRSGDHCTL